MDVAAWLQGLGLKRYVAVFRDNEIDWEALPKLTVEDLKDLGVVLGGHRQKLLAAIAALGTEAPAAAGTAASRVAPGPAEAERQQLTVMWAATWSARPSFRHGSTPRTFVRSLPPIIGPWPMSSGASTGLSRSTWAMACWSISATRERMRTMPNGRSGRGSA